MTDKEIVAALKERADIAEALVRSMTPSRELEDIIHEAYFESVADGPALLCMTRLRQIIESHGVEPFDAILNLMFYRLLHRGEMVDDSVIKAWQNNHDGMLNLFFLHGV